MIRPGEYRIIGRGFQDGIPCTWMIDFNGTRWISFDFELLRRQHDQATKQVERYRSRRKVVNFDKHRHRFK